MCLTDELSEKERIEDGQKPFWSDFRPSLSKMESEETSDHPKQKHCACKGIRTCTFCEASGKIPMSNQKDLETKTYLYCQDSQKAWSSSNDRHSNHGGDSISFGGIFILDDFITAEEEKFISEEIYKTPFVDSQSGRRKQDYGPKVNFKRRKVKTGGFTGLPDFSADLYKRMRRLDILSDFIPVEQCHLEYTPERGSAIDPHFDDFWLWGERLVTINLLSDTSLCFICDDVPNVEVSVPMRRRSLIVVYGIARHKWKHSIHRNDITQTRLAVTLRELSEEFTENGNRWDEGKQLLDIALTFKGKAIGSQTL